MKATRYAAAAAAFLLAGCAGIGYNALTPEGKEVIDYHDNPTPALRQALQDQGVVKPEHWAMIDAHQIQMGMNHFEAIASWGWPEVHKSMNSQGQWMQLIFSGHKYVELLNDEVVSVDQL